MGDPEGYKDDPALYEPIGNLIERNNARALPTHSTPRHPHTILVANCVKALERLPGWKRVRKRPVGRFLLADDSGRPRKNPGGGFIPIRVAVPGDPDVECLWTPPGANRPYVIMVECKTGSAELADNQERKRDHVTAGGCWHFVARNADYLYQDIMDRARV